MDEDATDEDATEEDETDEDATHHARMCITFVNKIFPKFNDFQYFFLVQ